MELDSIHRTLNFSSFFKILEDSEIYIYTGSDQVIIEVLRRGKVITLKAKF